MRKTLSLAIVLGFIGSVLATASPAMSGHSLCISVPPVALGSASVTLTLETEKYGPFVHVVGEGQRDQALGSPNGSIVYAVSGTGIPNEDGIWYSLDGAGYNLDKEFVYGVFGVQLSGDPTKNTLTLMSQNADGSVDMFTGTPQVERCWH